MTILTYSLITIPDFATGAKLHDLHGLNNKGTAKALFHLQAQQADSESLPSYLQHIISLSMLLTDEAGEQQTMTLKEMPEAALLNTFFDIIERYKPTLVTWNNEYFNAEIISYRTIKHSLKMSPHYTKKAHHFNLNDALLSSTIKTPLEDIAILLGLDAQKNRDSHSICDSYLADNTQDLYQYCENNVQNIDQIYQRYQRSHSVS